MRMYCRLLSWLYRRAGSSERLAALALQLRVVWQLHSRLLQRLLGVGVGTPSWAGQRLIKVRLAGACVDGQADPGGLHSSGDAAWKSGNRPRAIAGVDGVHPGFYLGLLWRQGARLCLHACVHAELACMHAC